MPRAGKTSPATLHISAQEHGGLRAKQGIQNAGRDDRLNIQILRHGSD
jgi:predicted metallopeptidase